MLGKTNNLVVNLCVFALLKYFFTKVAVVLEPKLRNIF